MQLAWSNIFSVSLLEFVSVMDVLKVQVLIFNGENQATETWLLNFLFVPLECIIWRLGTKKNVISFCASSFPGSFTPARRCVNCSHFKVMTADFRACWKSCISPVHSFPTCLDDYDTLSVLNLQYYLPLLCSHFVMNDIFLFHWEISTHSHLHMN